MKLEAERPIWRLKWLNNPETHDEVVGGLEIKEKGEGLGKYLEDTIKGLSAWLDMEVMERTESMMTSRLLSCGTNCVH